jgi:pantoate--beta-alanine ligase
MEIAKTIEQVRTAVRAARKKNKTIGLVPTMGALHIGHISLIEAAVKQTDFVVVSIFVNPTQFGPSEDFEHYPKSLDADLAICEKYGVDLVFVPDVEEMYPQENLSWVSVDKITEPLCGRLRPGHFKGVTTVCTKLFNIVLPDYAFFGQKDAQQTAVIKRMAADLNMPLEIVVCPTIREAEGLAVSSRNQYLNEQQKRDAALIYKSLEKCRSMVESDIFESELIISKMRKIINESPDIDIEYISIVDTDTLESLKLINKTALVAVAVKLGPARLIDNIIVDAQKY